MKMYVIKTKPKVGEISLTTDIKKAYALMETYKREGWEPTITTVDQPVAKLIGANGNIFNLLAIASRALRLSGFPELSKHMLNRVVSGKCDSYDKALQIIMEYVEVE